MALDSAKVDVGISGAFSYAPTATAAPTDAVTALAVAWLDVGYISEDGVTETRDRSTTNIIAWQNSDTVRSVVTESSITVQFVGIESNENMIELFYGAAVSAEGQLDIVPSASGGRRSFVLDYVDGDKQVRMYIPEGELQEVGDLVVAAGEPVGYDVTIIGYPSTAGYSARKWWSELDTTP